MLMQSKEQMKRLLIESSAKVKKINDHIHISVVEAGLVLPGSLDSEKDPPRGFDVPIILLLVSKLQEFSVTAAAEKKRVTVSPNVGKESKYSM